MTQLINKIKLSEQSPCQKTVERYVKVMCKRSKNKKQKKKPLAGQRHPEANQYQKSQRRTDLKATEKSRTN